MCCVLDRLKLWPAAEAKWGSGEYLRRELRGVACSVLSAPASKRRFSYWFDHSTFASDRVPGGYQATPLVESITMSIEEYLANQKPETQRCLYLQQALLMAGGGEAGQAGQAGLTPCAGLGDGIRHDITSGIDLPALRAIADAGGFGPWQRCQLFIGGASAVGARSILHFDQYDNLFVQIAGTKRFRIFEPQQTRSLYAYPIHHPLDTRAQVDLEHPDYVAFPRLAEAHCVELLLRPGQTLFLPAYWWHEARRTRTQTSTHTHTLHGHTYSPHARARLRAIWWGDGFMRELPGWLFAGGH